MPQTYYTVVLEKSGYITIISDNDDPFWCATYDAAKRQADFMREWFPGEKYAIYNMTKVEG